MKQFQGNRVALIALGIAIVSLLMVFFGGAKITKKTLLDKVLSRGELEIGYVVNPPALIKDPNTGKLSGIYYDAVELMAKNLSLKANWREEVGWGTMNEGLYTGRYDMVVGGIWPSASRSKKVDFSIPLYYSAMNAYVRADDYRFSTPNDINQEGVIIATLDGEMGSIIAKNDYPNVKTLSLPDNSSIARQILNVKTKKADITFVEKVVAEEFLANNPGTIKNPFDTYMRIFGNTIALPKGEEGFSSMINTSMQEIINSNDALRIVKSYENYPDSFYLPIKAFAGN
jgi:polar amino acid transport system substrate-binding protein